MTGSHRQPRTQHRGTALPHDEYGPHGGVGVLERPEADPEADQLSGDLDLFSGDPRITAQDVRTALGEDTDTLLAQADVEVDELIRLINAETTMLPAIRVPEKSAEDDGAVEHTGAAAEKADEREGVLAASAKTWKKRFLKGAALSVLITLTGGGAAALAMDKSVTIEVDGKTRTVHSFGDTVGEVLQDVGLEVGKHDVVSPSPQAPIGEDAVIHLERGRHLNIIVDGEKRETWVRATTVGEALDVLGLNDVVSEKGTKLSVPAGGQIPLQGMTLRITTLKTVTLFNGGKEPKKLTTHALTAGALLENLGLSLGEDDKVLEGLDFELSDGAEVHISRTGVTTVKEKETIEPEVKKIEDPDMAWGKTVVVEEGKPGKELVTYQITMRNGEQVAREEVASEVLVKPEPKVIRVGRKQPEITNGGVWSRLAQCESGGNWDINTGNGYYGGLQFSKSTWDAYGGQQFAEYPHQATRAEQITVAKRVREQRGGYGAWPSCAEQLGLPPY